MKRVFGSACNFGLAVFFFVSLCALSVRVLGADNGTHRSIVDIVSETWATPVISGGSAGAQYHSSYGPEKAFDGVTYSSDESMRWLGDMSKGTFLQISWPDTGEYPPVILSSYKLHGLSVGSYAWERSPTAWSIYGLSVLDEWILLDNRTGVVWDKSLAEETSSKEFEVASVAPCKAFKFVPEASNRSGESWTVGLMELEFFGVAASDGMLSVGSNTDGICECFPAAGIYSDIGTDEPVICSAYDVEGEEVYYRCAGYVLDKFDKDWNLVSSVTNMGVSAYSYSQTDGMQKLTWLYEPVGYRLDVSALVPDSCSFTVSPEPDIVSKYYSAGSEVNVSVVPASGKVFSYWTGDVPAGSETSVSFTASVTEPAAVFAVCSSPWTLSMQDSKNGTMDNGDWVLKVTVAGGEEVSVSSVLTNGASSVLDFRSPVSGDVGASFSIVSINGFMSNTNITHVFLPDTLKTLQGQAFYNSSRLCVVEPLLPDSLTTVGRSSFYGCTNLSGNLRLTNPDVVFSETWHSGSVGAFARTLITSAEITGNVSTIPESTFYQCGELRNVRIPDTLTRIGQSAFDSCGKLESVEPFFPESLIQLEASAFYNCVNLSGDLELLNPSLTMKNNNNTGWRGMFTGSLITSAKVMTTNIISTSAFSNCKLLSDVVLAEGLKTISESAFSGCTSLTNIVPFLPKSVSNVGGSAFVGCRSLAIPLIISGGEAVSLPHNNNQAVGPFYHTGITSADLSGNVPLIPNGCFSGCTNLETIIVSEYTTSIETQAFSGYGNDISSKLNSVYFLGDCPQEISSNIFGGKSSYGVAVYIPAGRESWENYGAENFSAPTDDELVVFAENFPDSEQKPFAVWSLGTYKCFVLRWVPPRDPILTTIVIVR